VGAVAQDRTNVRSPFFLVQQLLPILGEGSNIIVISSLRARAVVGKPDLDNASILAYAATKGAIETLVKNWAAILGPPGHPRKCSRARSDRHGHVELRKDRGRS
jgi:NAD(P)-dependent dehydrogenase (short-subunit alcohol dehydrogenase family)